MTAPINVDDRFKLTGRFLRSTGQIAGGEGQKVWTRVACDCGLCRRAEHIASDEKAYCFECDGKGWVRVELVHAVSNEPCPGCEGGRQRHFAYANVYRVGSLDVRNVDVDPRLDR